MQAFGGHNSAAVVVRMVRRRCSGSNLLDQNSIRVTSPSKTKIHKIPVSAFALGFGLRTHLLDLCTSFLIN